MPFILYGTLWVLPFFYIIEGEPTGEPRMFVILYVLRAVYRFLFGFSPLAMVRG